MTISQLIQDWDIVVVSHGSGDALAAEWGETPLEVRERVICIENSDSSESLRVATDLFGSVERTPNRGLSAANNAGFRKGRAPYVLFANPDIECRAESLDAFRRWLDRHGGLVGPRLVNEDGSPQESCRGWPSPARQILNRLRPAHHPGNRSYLWPETTRGFVPWLLGAAVATRRRDLDRVGGWPDEYFLYFEDTELAWRYWNNGLPVAVLEDEKWFHAWRRESRGFLTASTRHHLRSAFRFYLQHPKMFIGLADAAVRRSREA